jgi:hypothetical protein
MWPFKKKKPASPVRMVLLTLFNDKTKIVEAFRCQSCFYANYDPSLKGSISILLSDGKIAGCRTVKSWLPHSGWDGTETIYPHGWICINDEKPRCVWVFALSSAGIAYACRYDSSDDAFIPYAHVSSNCPLASVTHWMPRPISPQDSSQCTQDPGGDLPLP